jgi:hypothetical protein
MTKGVVGTASEGCLRAAGTQHAKYTRQFLSGVPFDAARQRALASAARASRVERGSS